MEFTATNHQIIMIPAPLPFGESERLARLERFLILDTPPEAGFDRITRTAALVVGMPISLVSLVDSDRQWFKSSYGLEAKETPRRIAFCSHAILQRDVFVVEDTLEDERFRDNPLVVSDPGIRFYAGAPLITKDNYQLGTLCVIDRQPRILSDAQKTVLRDLADMVMDEMELRLVNEELRRATAARDMFFAQISHELRTPLNAIIGFSEALQSGIADGAPDRRNEYLALISSSSRELSDLLTDMLEFARDGKAPEVTLISVSPCRLIETMMPLLRQLAQPSRLKITAALAPEIRVKADERVLRRILTNLCTNAIKYNVKDGSVLISGERIDNGFFRLSVEDSGVGIAPELHDRVFSLYDRLGQTDSLVAQGSGVGLHIARRMASEIGGRLGFKSRPGQGSRFWIDLPMASAEALEELAS